MGRKIRTGALLILVLAMIYTQQAVIYAQNEAEKNMKKTTESENSAGTNGEDKEQEKPGGEEGDKDKEPEQPEIKRYELEIPKADGKNGYYLSKPSVMITHNGAYGTTVYELKHGEDTLLQGRIKYIVSQEAEEQKTKISLEGEVFEEGKNILHVFMEDEEGNVIGTSRAIDEVDIEAKELCPRYVARVVKNIKLAPSPKWMQHRLMTAGIRPINNIVDITNYVMEEYGQPMHAYDYDQIAGKKIVVRTAAGGEKFVTLDGQERILNSSTLMICDGERAVGVAGVMGGENSMITDDVKTMLFEAACFDGANIRISAKKAGLRTDASGKFEKGLDPYNAEAAINRACELIEELGAGEVVGGMVDVFPVKPEEKVLPFQEARHQVRRL